MNRQYYFNFIEEKLNNLSFRIKEKGKLNILDLNVHSEDFYMHLFNKIFDWNLKNVNKHKLNVEAIDLADDINKIIVQVSAVNTYEKIENTIKKIDKSIYDGYRFKFISISKDAKNLRNKTYNNINSIEFNPKDDIYDNVSILSLIKSLEIDKQKELYDFIRKELGSQVDTIKLESNLAHIINLISKEDLTKNGILEPKKIFEIENKINFNILTKSNDIINDYKVHYIRLVKIYDEFDAYGSNKSLSVLNAVRNEYLILKDNFKNDELFFEVIKNIREIVLNSKNYIEIPIEELDLCLNILIVDAFIRCKIFETPLY